MSSNPAGSGNTNTAQPSSILFFIAVAIGVLIALVFIFFSMRYYVRTKLGIYATARMTTTTDSGIVLLTGDFAMQAFNAYNSDLNAQIRRARRRRRFLKKRRLTEEEVNHLFPVRTYQDWLDGGAERDADNRDIYDLLKEENEELRNETTGEGENDNEQSTPTPDHNANVDENNDTNAYEILEDSSNKNTTNDIESEKPSLKQDNIASSEGSKAEIDLGSPLNDDMHFDSGTCAICIDTFEPSDQVRGLICGHVFHQECLDPWLTKRKACCPMCKRDYYMKKPNENADESNEDNDNEEDQQQNDIENQFDVNSMRNFADLQYTTLAARVQEILARNPEIEEAAKEKIKKYLSFKWRVFWFLMGISRTDLMNSAIATEDARRRENARNNTSNENTETTAGGNDGQGEAAPGADSNNPVSYNMDNRNRVENTV